MEWYSSTGFPRERDLGGPELVSLLKRVMVWDNLPLEG